MQIVMNYVFRGIEYMVYEAQEYVPGAAGIRLLGSRRYGIGADRILIMDNLSPNSNFQIFTADGNEIAAAEQDYLIVEHHRKMQKSTMQNIGRIAENEFLSFEIHLTECFVGRLKEADVQSRIIAC
ncbi:hypothetical protein [Pectinatus haikarae]|uniref:Uncharacterized protein n=1 Tax=Pectinatus haikarae TaxID=349096 RepID=A0ABT9Y5P0_9FIRM|nr:hypothetical protein [Pectinatus haikarae]MDQ0203149.1 hypothetical protein [Pectinatus haikarae]